MPSWQDWDWMQLPTSAIPWCTVVDVKRDPLSFYYRFWGSSRTNLYGMDYTGKSISEVKPQTIGNKIFKEYAQLIEHKTPQFVITEKFTADASLITYQMLRLPFSAETHVTQILELSAYIDTELKKVHGYYHDVLPEDHPRKRDQI